MYTKTDMAVFGRRSLFLFFGLLLLGGAGSVHALVINGSSSSYGEMVDLTLSPVLLSDISIASGPLPISSGIAPAPYNDSDSAASASVSAGFVLNLSTGLLETNAGSTIDGAIGTRSASADASVGNLGLSVFSGLFGLAADEVQSSATITGDFNSLNAIGSTTLVNAGLTSLALSLGLGASPDPNTNVDILGLFGLTGVSLILNEQILTGDGLTSRGLIVNAIHVVFDDFLFGTNTLNGDIIISHSEAQAQAQADPAHVPEPGTVALQVLGIAALLLRRVGRRIA